MQQGPGSLAAPTFGFILQTGGPGTDPLVLRDLAQAAEDLGFDSIWVSDHVVIPAQVESHYPYQPDGRFRIGPDAPYLEALTTLSYLAGCTRRVRLGTYVLVLPYRHPLLVGKAIASLDVLSGGRVELGVGAGWMQEEFEAFGHTYFEQRGRVLEEQLHVLKAVWTQDIANYHGEFFQFGPLGTKPHPVQRPHVPLLVGGSSPAAIRRAARVGDGWLTTAGRPPGDLPPDEIAAGISVMRAEAARVGRDPDALRVVFGRPAITLLEESSSDSENRWRFRGTPEQIAADITLYQSVGVADFVFGLGPGSPNEIQGRMQRFMQQVRPALAGRPPVTIPSRRTT